jgi:hypothetical protein
MGRVSVSESLMRSRHSSMPESVADQDGIVSQERGSWFGRNHVEPQRARVRCGGTPGLRDKEDTHPHRISPMWNVETPLRSVTRAHNRYAWQSASRKDGPIPQQDRKAQEAKASRRKARGIHNPLDRAAEAEIPIPKGS